MVVENMAALLVFGLWLAAFALGYALRGYYAGAFNEWANASTYRDGAEREGGAGYGRR